MWVNSKQAAEILGVKYDALAKSVKRAEKTGKKFCTIKPNILGFSYTDGIGRGGKTLQIWIDDDLINDKNSEISRADKASAVNLVNTAVRPLNFTNGESDGDIYADTKLDARDSVDIRGRNSGVFGGSLANTGARRDQEQTQINQNERVNDANRGNGRNQRSDASDSSYAKDDERGEAKAYSDAYAGDGIYECQDNEQRGLWLQSRSESQRGAERGAVKGVGDEDTNGSQRGQILRQGQKLTDGREGGQWAFGGERLCECASHSMEYGHVRSSRTSSFPAGAFAQEEENGRRAPVLDGNKEVVECELVESDGLNLSGAGGVNLPATLSLPQSKFASASEAKKERALIKKMIIDEWNKAKGKIKEVDFIEYINAKNIYSLKLTANKLYAWQRAYKAGGIDALIDDRTSTKECEIERLGLRELAIKLIHAQRGRINSYNIYKMLNYYAVSENLLSHDDFQGKKDEIISYEAVNRFVKKYLKANPMLKTLIEKGEDGVISKYLSAMGKSNWAAYTINQIVEIDASPLDIICSASDLCDKIGFNSVNNVFKDKEEFKKFVEEWQQRYTIIGLIDTYSGVASFHVTSTENSSGIARATAKYILRYGKPRVIKGDNGKAFKSKANFSFLGAIGVEYKAVKAYSGWLKPYVEKNFGSLQNGLSEWLKGFIGHNINQRQAIEFFFSKKERRLKKGFKTNLKDLNSIDEINSLIDDYAEKFLNNRYLDRLGKTCSQAYNEKAKEAEPMNALELSLYLAQKQDKCVLKQGVSVDGVWFSNEMLYKYSRVFVRANLDNVKEQFVFDENDKFVCVAAPKDLEEGSSVETARAAQKIVYKRVKALKEKSSQDRAEVEAFFTDYVKTVEASRAAQPTVKSANDEIAARIELDHAQRKNADISEEYMQFASKGKKKKEEKEILGFEAMAQAKFKAV